MVPHADKLLEKADQGVKLTTDERRHVVQFLMATMPDSSNVEIARRLQCHERTIRDDKIKVREDRAKLIKEDDISLVIADIALNFDRQIRDIEASKRKCKYGSRTYLEHCRAIFKMELEKVTALQGLGYYPKNLGTMTTQKFEFTASVGMLDESGRPVPVAIESGRKSMDVLDAEFSDDQLVDTKLLAAPVEQQINELDEQTNGTT